MLRVLRQLQGARIEVNDKEQVAGVDSIGYSLIPIESSSSSPNTIPGYYYIILMP